MDPITATAPAASVLSSLPPEVQGWLTIGFGTLYALGHVKAWVADAPKDASKLRIVVDKAVNLAAANYGKAANK